jgi:hypothetical protein
MNGSNKSLALKYLITGGWSVIPVDGKVPLLQSWAEYQTRLPEADEVSEWWDKWPTANIGVVCGKISNLSVVDVDLLDKANPGSIASHDDLPETMTARTGSGGLHFYYEYSEMADGRKTLRDHVDIKSHGGFVVVPPSLHASGNRYEWLTKGVNPQPFPVHLLPERARGGFDADMFKGASLGHRNNDAASLAGLCVKNKMTPAQTLDFLTAWNTQNEPPLSDRELRTVVASIFKTDQRNHPKEDTSLIHLFDAAAAEEKFAGKSYSTGYKKLDEAMKGGIRIGDLGIISGHTGHGKSLLAAVITSVILKAQEPVVWFEFEMMAQEIKERFEAMGIGREHAILVPKKYASGEMDWIEEKIVEGKQKGVQVFFIDLLDFLRPKISDDRKKLNFNLPFYITMICEQLKEVCKRHAVAVVLMAHTRKPQQGRDPEPDGFDLKDSGGIGQHADWILMVHRLSNRKAKEVFAKKNVDFDDPDSIFDLEDTEESDYSRLRLWKNRRSGLKPSVVVKMVNGTLAEVDFRNENS